MKRYSLCTYGEVARFDDGWPHYTYEDLALALWWVRVWAAHGVEFTIIPHPGRAPA